MMYSRRLFIPSLLAISILTAPVLNGLMATLNPTYQTPSLSSPAYAVSFQRYSKKPFNILGQQGAIFKKKGQKQQFLVLKNMNSLMATYLFGNLKNQLIVQQLASQVVGKTKKGGKLNIQVTEIKTIASGNMTLPNTSGAAPYQHVRAYFKTSDPTEPNKAPKSRSMDLTAIRSAGTQSNIENIITTYSLDKKTSSKTTQQFLNTLSWSSI